MPRALFCVEISEATLFRGVELWQPTIIVDEADVILVNNEPLRAVINSGWTRGASSAALHRRREDAARISDVLSESARHEGSQAAGYDLVAMHHDRAQAKTRGRES